VYKRQFPTGRNPVRYARKQSELLREFVPLLDFIKVWRVWELALIFSPLCFPFSISFKKCVFTLSPMRRDVEDHKKPLLSYEGGTRLSREIS